MNHFQEYYTIFLILITMCIRKKLKTEQNVRYNTHFELCMFVLYVSVVVITQHKIESCEQQQKTLTIIITSNMYEQLYAFVKR